MFFSISGAVILKVFAAADNKSRQSAELEKVIICAQSIAEAYSESGSAPEAVLTALGASYVSGSDLSDVSRISVFPDDDNIQLETSEERTKTSAGEMAYLTLRFLSDGEEIYSMTCSAYIPAGGVQNGENR